MKKKKQADPSTGPNTYIVTASVVLKSFIKKNGQATDKQEYYLRRSIQDYFIKFCESQVSREDLDLHLSQLDGFIKTAKLEVEFRDGAWDICEEEEMLQSRMGAYVIIHRILS